MTIDAGGKGTVFLLQADGAVLRGLTLQGSGDSHDTDDSCLDVRGHRNTLEQLVISDCLFGIDLKQSNDNRRAQQPHFLQAPAPRRARRRPAPVVQP